MARIPSFHGDTQEQDLISQLLLWLKIFTSKYILICHIFASSRLGVYPHQLGRGEAWLRRVWPSRGANDNHVNILEGWLVCQSQFPPLLSCCQPQVRMGGGGKGKKKKTKQNDIQAQRRLLSALSQSNTLCPGWLSSWP